MPRELSAKLRALPGVLYASAFQEEVFRWHSEAITGLGIEGADCLRMVDLEASAADVERFFADRDAILVGAGAARRLGWHIGESVTLTAEAETRHVRVAGIIRPRAVCDAQSRLAQFAEAGVIYHAGPRAATPAGAETGAGILACAATLEQVGPGIDAIDSAVDPALAATAVRGAVARSVVAPCCATPAAALALPAAEEPLSNAAPACPRGHGLLVRGAAGAVPLSALEALAATPGVDVAAGATSYPVLRAARECGPIVGWAVQNAAAYVRLTNLVVAPAALERFEEARDGALLGAALAGRLGVSVGDVLDLTEDAEPYRVWHLRVAGTFRTRDAPAGGEGLLYHAALLHARAELDPAYRERFDFVAGCVASDASVAEVIARVRQRLAPELNVTITEAP